MQTLGELATIARLQQFYLILNTVWYQYIPIIISFELLLAKNLGNEFLLSCCSLSPQPLNQHSTSFLAVGNKKNVSRRLFASLPLLFLDFLRVLSLTQARL